jgi:signal transduction histidine kinase
MRVAQANQIARRRGTLPNEEPWNADSSLIDSIGVEVVSEIRVDPDAPMLSFQQNGASRSYWIDEQGINALRQVADRHAPIVELKLDAGEGQSLAILLALRDRRGSGHWGAARLIRLDKFVAADDGAAFQSFLTQVSAVLADLQHDLRQPLAAISLAAHNGPGLFQAGMTDAAVAKFARILEQVDHCEDRMQRRIARFGADAPGGVVLPFILAVHAAISPVRRWMEEAQATMIVSGSLPSGSVRVIPGTIEMLLRYILKRSVETTRARRAVRVVDIVLGEDPAALRVTNPLSGRRRRWRRGRRRCHARVRAADDGADWRRNPRADRGERREGVAATLLFPRYEPAGGEVPDQFAFASSLR